MMGMKRFRKNTVLNYKSKITNLK